MKYFDTIVDVRFDEIDEMGIVHHKHYFSWFEISRFQIINAMKIEYSVLKSNRIAFPVIKSSCQYHLSAKFGDTLVIQTSLSPEKRACLTFCYIVRRRSDFEMLAQGSTTHVITKNGKLNWQLPAGIKEKMDDFMKSYGWKQLSVKCCRE